MPPRKSSSPNPLPTWKGEPDLIGLQFTLQPTATCSLPSNYTYWLHAWFLDQIRQVDSEISEFLHDNQTEKAFTLSSLLNTRAIDIPETSDRTLTFSDQSTYTFQITALCAPVCQVFKQWLQQWLQQPTPQIKLRGGSFQVLNCHISLPVTTYDQLWETTATDLTLTFLTPTSFRKNNNHMPLPIPENLFHSYLRRWNIFAHLEFDQDEFLDWINTHVVIVRHELRSRKIQPGKQGSVTGFIGTLQLSLTQKAQQEPEYIQLVHSLIKTAPYFGTGHKVTFGLGQTRLGWTALPVSSSATIDEPRQIAAESTITTNATNAATPRANLVNPTIANVPQLRKNLIKARIAELEPQFMATRKRQGGDRTRQIAHLWAIIIARQEAGDSLKAIAADLKLPYETVKKYAQLARKQLQS
jgi:CRISPR-associated endoribonuclease Cas6